MISCVVEYLSEKWEALVEAGWATVEVYGRMALMIFTEESPSW